MRLPRPARRAVLVVHVSASAGWLGLTVGLLALGATAAGTGSTATAEAAYRAMKIFGDWLIVPVSLLTLVSGLVLSLGTPWGLLRHRWVVVKFWLTLATTAASIFALRGTIDQAAAAVAAGDAAGEAASSLVAAPSVSLTAYTFMTAISVLKPWGLTRWGRRSRESARGSGTGRTGGRTGTPAPPSATAAATAPAAASPTSSASPSNPSSDPSSATDSRPAPAPAVRAAR
ncbi:DUF2269 domain-containing protein [Streptomyces lycii]|uniref:DUF2269 domain-containing protein n=1 Tax=Streptomyces lycii TaxID=2654337 RepID=UPI0038B67251